MTINIAFSVKKAILYSAEKMFFVLEIGSKKFFRKKMIIKFAFLKKQSILYALFGSVHELMGW